MIMRRQAEPERWERRFSDANLEQDLDQEEIRGTARQAATIHRADPAFNESRSPIKALERLGLVKYGRRCPLCHSLSPAPSAGTGTGAVCYTSDKSDETYLFVKTGISLQRDPVRIDIGLDIFFPRP